MNNVISAFEQMYHATYDKVSFYVLTKCGKVPEVEDILQETYAELFQVLEDKGDMYILYPEAFVMQLAKGKIYRYYSEKERRGACSYVEVSDAENVGEKKHATHEEDWQDALVDKLTAEEVMAYLAEKDELTCEIFYQHYFQDKTLKEIAQSCGMKETTVKQRLYRTLQELRKMKRFAIIAAIILLAALLAKPVYTWAKDVIFDVIEYFEERMLTQSIYSEEERKQREKDTLLAFVEEQITGIEWESEEAKEEARQQLLEMLGIQVIEESK